MKSSENTKVGNIEKAYLNMPQGIRSCATRRGFSLPKVLEYAQLVSKNPVSAESIKEAANLMRASWHSFNQKKETLAFNDAVLALFSPKVRETLGEDRWEEFRQGQNPLTDETWLQYNRAVGDGAPWDFLHV